MAACAMRGATEGLLQAHIERAESVIQGQEALPALRRRVEENSFSLLALQAPVAADLRAVVSALRIAAALERMGALAAHVAKIARRRFPDHAVPEEVSELFADMGEVAVGLCNGVCDALSSRDPSKAAQIRHDDDEMNDLHLQLMSALMGPEWKWGVSAAVDVALLGRFYERYADQAVQVARRVIFLATGSYEHAPTGL